MSSMIASGSWFKFSLSKFLQLRLNNFLFRFLPFALSRWYLALLGKVFYFFKRKEKKLICQTLTHVLKGKLSGKALKRKIKDTFQGIFDHYHEKLFVGYSNFPKLLKFLKTQVYFEGEDKLKEALGQGKGVILVTGHFGAVELLPGALAVQGYPASMICRFQTSRLREALSKRAEDVGLNLIDADEGNIVLAAMKALKQGRILITECDEFDEWRQDPHRQTFFLNCKLGSDRTLDLLQKRSGAQVVTALMRRAGNKTYNCGLEVMINGAGGRLPLGEQCLQTLEAMVEAYPEQWYQWKKFCQMIKGRFEVEYADRQVGYLAPEAGISVPHQA